MGLQIKYMLDTNTNCLTAFTESIIISDYAIICNFCTILGLILMMKTAIYCD